MGWRPAGTKARAQTGQVIVTASLRHGRSAMGASRHRRGGRSPRDGPGQWIVVQPLRVEREDGGSTPGLHAVLERPEHTIRVLARIARLEVRQQGLGGALRPRRQGGDELLPDARERIGPRAPGAGPQRFAVPAGGPPPPRRPPAPPPAPPRPPP